MRDRFAIEAAKSRDNVATDIPVGSSSARPAARLARNAIEVFSRNDDGSWTLREARSGAVELAAIGCMLSVEDVCRNPLAG